MCVKIKVYCDSGAMNKKVLRRIYSKCVFYHYPYDSADRPKDFNIILATPSETQWRDAHNSWGEDNFTWADHSASEIFSEIISIIGRDNNRRDALHLDSAYKEGCHIFLTTDKIDIYSNKFKLTDLCKLKIFYVPDELDELEKYIESVKTIGIIVEDDEPRVQG